jgi:hypothetical protein
VPPFRHFFLFLFINFRICEDDEYMFNKCSRSHFLAVRSIFLCWLGDEYRRKQERIFSHRLITNVSQITSAEGSFFNEFLNLQKITLLANNSICSVRRVRLAAR